MTARSYLFVPADRPERYDKALAAGADAVIIDLEDAVAPDAKVAARGALASWLAQASSAVWVRVNAAGSAWYADDIALCRHACVAGAMLPKSEEVATLAEASRLLAGKALLPMIETAKAFEHARALAAAPGVARLAFGSLDFQLDLGIPGEDDALLFFRSQLVLASRLAGRAAPIDGVTTQIHDDAAIRANAERAHRLGFGAKLCIHPRQVGIVNRCFSPSDAERDWASRVIDAVTRTGGAAVAVDGRMVDLPVIRRAEQILATKEPSAR
jgi:citrate lyase subunit beta/citryl-CoA lyase